MFEYVDTITRLIIALSVAYNIWQTWRVKQNVSKIEKNTNGLQAALVASTAKASLAEGTAVGTVEGHAAGLDQGRNEVRK